MQTHTMALVAHAPGGPDVMQWESVPMAPPGPGEALLRQTAIGVNFLDIYYRSGLYPWPDATLIPGAEAAGVVEQVGAGVTTVRRGDRVAYVMRLGAYRQSRIVAADRLVKLPDAISDNQAASVILKGLTVHSLVTSCYRVKPGDTVLVHAAAGGVGLLLGQWLAALGARAIGTAGTDEKAALAKAHGYDAVINYKTTDFVAAVMDLTAGQKCAAVYDSVGADTWRGSLKCLAPFGMFVTFGQSSGMIRDFTLADLAMGGSLSANRPIVMDYIATQAELARRATALFSMIESGKIRAGSSSTHPLQDAAAVHQAMADRQTSGSAVLIP